VKKALMLGCAVTILCCAFTMCLGQRYADGYSDGQKDANEDCKRADAFWRGVVGGVFYVAYAYAGNPKVPPSSRMKGIQGTSDVYQEGYIAGYGEALKSCRVRNALLGWGVTWTLTYFVILLLAQ